MSESLNRSADPLSPVFPEISDIPVQEASDLADNTRQPLFGRLRSKVGDAYALAGSVYTVRIVPNKLVGKLATAGAVYMAFKAANEVLPHGLTAVAHAQDLHNSGVLGAEVNGHAVSGADLQNHAAHALSQSATTPALHPNSDQGLLGAQVNGKTVHGSASQLPHAVTRSAGETHNLSASTNPHTNSGIGAEVNGKTVSSSPLHHQSAGIHSPVTHQPVASHSANTLGAEVNGKPVTGNTLAQPQHLPVTTLHNTAPNLAIPNPAHNLVQLHTPNWLNVHGKLLDAHHPLQGGWPQQHPAVGINHHATTLNHHSQPSSSHSHNHSHDTKHTDHKRTPHKHHSEKSDAKDTKKDKIKKPRFKTITLRPGDNPWSVSQRMLKLTGHHLNAHQLQRIWNLDKHLMHMNHLNLTTSKLLQIGSKLKVPLS